MIRFECDYAEGALPEILDLRWVLRNSYYIPPK